METDISHGSRRCAPTLDAFAQQYGRDVHVYSLWSLAKAYPNGRLRYHLGQLCALTFLNRLARAGYNVSCVICDPLHQRITEARAPSVSLDLNVARQFIDYQKDGSIRVSTMSDEVDDVLRHEHNRSEVVRDLVRTGFSAFRDYVRSHQLSDEVKSGLWHCRSFGDKSNWPSPVREYASRLARNFRGVPEEKLMAAVYAYVRAPMWFDTEWIGEVCAWLAATAKDDARAVVVEANRSAYSWLTHRCFVAIGLLRRSLDGHAYRMPDNCFLPPVLTVPGILPMELSTPAGCVFIDASRIEITTQLLNMSADARYSVSAWLLDEVPVQTESEQWQDAVVRFIAASQRAIAGLLRHTANESPLRPRNIVTIETSTTPSPHAAAHQQKVISVHGIRTYAPWQKALSCALSDSSFFPYPFDYGKFHLWDFARSAAREEVIGKFIEFYAQHHFGREDPPSIIAHSFGSYVVCSALERNMDIHVTYVILLGSIVIPSFNWSRLIISGRVKGVLNERAGRDSWVTMAGALVPDVGPSGKTGFHDLANGAVLERDHRIYKHSDALNGVAYGTAWRTFLTTGTV